MRLDVQQLSEAARMVVILKASSHLDITELHAAIQAKVGAHDVAQIFDPKRVISRTHLIGAYLNALYSFSERRNIAKNASTEMLLFAAMTRKITDAITLIGAKSSSDFILFCSDLAVSKKMAGLLTSSKEFRPAKPRSSSASHFIGIENDDEAVLQRMALSRL